MIAAVQPCFSVQSRSQPSLSGPHNDMMKQTCCGNHLSTFDVQHTSKRCEDDRYVSDTLAKLPCVILSCFAQPLRSLNRVLGRRTLVLQHLVTGLLTGLFSYEV